MSSLNDNTHRRQGPRAKCTKGPCSVWECSAISDIEAAICPGAGPTDSPDSKTAPGIVLATALRIMSNLFKRFPERVNWGGFWNNWISAGQCEETRFCVLIVENREWRHLDRLVIEVDWLLWRGGCGLHHYKIKSVRLRLNYSKPQPFCLSVWS